MAMKHKTWLLIAVLTLVAPSGLLAQVSNNIYDLGINHTGFAPGYQAPNIYDMAIDNTGKVSRTTNFGGRINYTDGYFRGVVSNGRRSAGTIYYNDGRRESCTQFDSNGKFNSCAVQEWPDGSWTIGNWSHGYKNGNFSKAVASNGYLTYYDEVWSNGNCISSVKVSSPSQSISLWDDNPYSYDSNNYGGGSSSSSSSSNSGSSGSSSCWRCKGSGDCTLCKGSGYIKRGLNNYGANSAHKCSNCGGGGKCPVCHGRGR